MEKVDKAIKKALQLDSLIDMVRQSLLSFKDPRNRIITHSFHDIVMSGFGMFHFKYPSMHNFEQQTESERINLQNLFGIRQLCDDSQLRNILDQIDPMPLRSIFKEGIELLKKADILSEYRILHDYLIFSVDGVQYFSSNDIHCDGCLTKKHQNGTTTYYHSMLCAAIVHPDHKEVFLSGSEPIHKEDGAKKNDCELNAAKRLFDFMDTEYKEEKIIFVEDALYSNGPHVKRIQANPNWKFVLNIKPKQHKSLFKSFEMRREQGQVKKYEYTDEQGTTHRFEFTNNLPINESHGDIRVNMLLYEEEKKNGKQQKFSWITCFTLRRNNVNTIMRIGRARWKIENETFNTLKNQGYHFAHNFGHGFNFLSLFLALLMLLAFQIDQITQKCNKAFRTLWKAAKTKLKLWQLFRSIFMVRVVRSFEQLYQIAAQQLGGSLQPAGP